ncbi:folylpolyglutamate synthase [Aspergillus saccharolyticus JOP 1030-1]|uniref:Folylpolyglutamate synthase n=1 Tax=Aspergillus saccharolyticus JOP 1030-1 TaxID=1450539 RepID=A0A318ZLY1_9EURO|nr:folylpolyglutamate synthase [Aspergillus saccharolyticus JOP 1030-1]PYH45463.1 folylpolyglutamate synthase [Aspergillus saccharolyticus JOP 1030-1]
MKRSYENALKLLESRRRKARPRTPALASINQDAVTPTDNQALRGVPSLVGMEDWLRKLGYSENDVNGLNIVHIAGTKGKGSTCAFTRSFLRAHGSRTGYPNKVGLYTSPDLQCIRERIQINDEPIPEELFTRYFFEVWERLEAPNLEPSVLPMRQPRYLQLLALLAFHTFIRENVDAAIFETHHGGEYDATNVIRRPIVTAITALGMDHVAQLGPTIENVAWHKSGIFKPGAPAFSVFQEESPAEVLRFRAAERQTTLRFVPMNESLPANNKTLSVPVQRLNCSLALELARAWLQAKAPQHTLDESDIAEGVSNFKWAGRFESIEDGASGWFVDGAHNTLSLEQAARWFVANTNTPLTNQCRILIFSHFSEERDGLALVEALANSLAELQAMPEYVIFTTYEEREDGTTRIDKTLKPPETPFPDLCTIYTSLWRQRDSRASVSSEATIEGAIKLAKRISAERGGAQILVTGSLHLAGGALSILRPQEHGTT